MSQICDGAQQISTEIDHTGATLSTQNGSTRYHVIYPTRCSGTLAGKKNYKAAEISMLLDVIQEILPLGKNEWVAAHEVYKKWARENGYQERDNAMIKQKFDRMTSEKKPTGVGQCPSPIRRAKKIAQDIQLRASAGSLGIEPETNCADNAELISTGQSEEATLPLGARMTRRSPLSAGIKMRKYPHHNDDVLRDSFVMMAQKFGSIADVISTKPASSVEELVAKQVASAIDSTNKRIDELKDLILSLK